MTELIFLSLSLISPSPNLCLLLDCECLRVRLTDVVSSMLSYDALSLFCGKVILICRFLSIFLKKPYPKTTLTFLDSGFSLNAAILSEIWWEILLEVF